MTALQDMVAQHWEKRAAGGEYAQHFKAKMQAHGIDPKKINEAPKAKVTAAFKAVDTGWKGTKEASLDEEILTHVKEAYAVNGVLPPGYEEAFFAMEKQALLAEVVKGVGQAGGSLATYGKKLIGGGLSPRVTLKTTAGRAAKTLGEAIAKHPGSALALGAAGTVGVPLGTAAKTLRAKKEQQ
jgi:hypothetical protein